MVANDTTLLYAVAPLAGFGGVPVAETFVGCAETLVAGLLGVAEELSPSPLHLFCSQHVASHFS